MSTTDRRLTDEEIRRIVASYPAPAKRVKPEVKPKLTLVASRDREPEDKVASVAQEREQVASVPLEPEDVEIVREALAHRRVMIGEDVVEFDKITEARVTMRWCLPTPVAERPDAKVVFAYDPYSRERMRGDD